MRRRNGKKKKKMMMGFEMPGFQSMKIDSPSMKMKKER